MTHLGLLTSQNWGEKTLWSTEASKYPDSLAKLLGIMEMCDEWLVEKDVSFFPSSFLALVASETGFFG